MGFGESRPPEALSNYTGFLLNWVAAGSRRNFERELDGLGLRLQGFALMNVVSADPGLTQQDLTKRTHIDPSTMVQTLDALNDSGLAERRPHETDRRKHTIHLTDEGRRTLRRAREAAHRAGEDTMSELEDAEREELRRLLRKMAGLDSSTAARRSTTTAPNTGSPPR